MFEIFYLENLHARENQKEFVDHSDGGDGSTLYWCLSVDL